MREITVFSGSAHPGLAREICERLGVPLSPARLNRFANDCLEVQLQANCRERDVFIVQPLSPPVQEHLVELLLMIDAARGASASRITPVIPFYAYARSDKKDMPRVSIGGRLVADLLVTAGASRVLTLALHSPQVHGFFSVPVDHLHALGEMAAHFRRYDLSNAVVVAPDLGYAKEASAFARRLGTGVAMAVKKRFENDKVVISDIIGEVKGRDVFVIDDEIAKGSTQIELLGHLRREGARTVRIACTHGLFSGGALDRLSAQDDVLEIVSTNTIPVAEPQRYPKLTVLSIAPALAEAMRRIHAGESVSELFHA
ncbi:MAG: ribose-phosphate pyrophosphokinase [Alphaproteobacteria bacterium]|nr:ribose-phosphate pyrophosphokinase [Alphaproteobacteria bacterium]MCW5740295.1 ribose-phosphate pyrophosphokinase [Alphaproteobacteria bacterium]